MPLTHDPSLSSSSKPVEYVDIFVDDFIGLTQKCSKGSRVRQILMHAIADIFRPLEASDNQYGRQSVSVKKLMQGDCLWGIIIMLVLGWIVDSANMSIHLPPQ